MYSCQIQGNSSQDDYIQVIKPKVKVPLSRFISKIFKALNCIKIFFENLVFQSSLSLNEFFIKTPTLSFDPGKLPSFKDFEF